jgi:hypothetical protein
MGIWDNPLPCPPATANPGIPKANPRLPLPPPPAWLYSAVVRVPSPKIPFPLGFNATATGFGSIPDWAITGPASILGYAHRLWLLESQQ